MITIHEHAERLWKRYGRLRADGRVYLIGEYIGRIGKDSDGKPFTFMPRERRIGFVGAQPVALVERFIA